MTGTATVLLGLLSLLADADLFETLDTNQDGVVSKSEISPPQQPWFARAVRVSDADSDGQLSRAELDAALTDPEPRQVVGSRRQIDLQRMDRNGDGEISLSEVPPPMKERFQMQLDRVGRDSIPVDELKRLLGTRAVQSGGKPADRKMDQPMLEARSRSGQGKRAGIKSGGNAAMSQQAAQAFRRLDANSDGRVTRREARRAPRFLERLDGNGDGIVERSELPGQQAGASKNRPSERGQGGQSRPAGQLQPSAGDGAARFDRMDEDGDGMIQRSEAPERMRAAFSRLDRNRDGGISPAELSAARARRGSRSGRKKQR